MRDELWEAENKNRQANRNLAGRLLPFCFSQNYERMEYLIPTMISLKSKKNLMPMDLSGKSSRRCEGILRQSARRCVVLTAMSRKLVSQKPISTVAQRRAVFRAIEHPLEQPNIIPRVGTASSWIVFLSASRAPVDTSCPNSFIYRIGEQAVQTYIRRQRSL